MQDWADLAYVHMLERVPVDMRDDFDEWLVSEPDLTPVKELTAEQADLYAAFGFRRSA